MNPNDTAAMVVVIVFIVMAASVIRMWISRRGVPPKALSDIDERLTRIEQAVDAISLEVERISEGQRFTTKLLAERKEPAEIPARRS